MRILRMRLVNFGGVRDRTLRFSPEGVTVLVGPNETGKSTLMTALNLLLEFPDSSKHGRVRDAQPVGRDVGPFVEAEFVTGPYRLTYSKRWLQSPETVLHIVGAGGTRNLTGHEAHQRAKELLDETMDRALWDALRVQQGQLSQVPLAKSASLREALDKAAGGSLGGSEEESLLDRVASERSLYLTNTGRPTGVYKQTKGRAEEAWRSTQALEDRLREAERRVEEIPRLEKRIRELDENKLREANRLEEYKAQHERVQRQAAKVAEIKTAVAEAERDLEKQERAFAERERLIGEVKKATVDLDKCRRTLANGPDLKSLEKAKEDAENDSWQRNADAERATARRMLAQSDLDYLQDRSRLDDLADRLELARDAQGDLRNAEAVLSGNTITRGQLDSIEKAQDALSRATAQLEVGSARFELKALSDVDVVVNGDPQTLATGMSKTWNVAGSLDVCIDGLLSARVRSGGEAERLERHVRDADSNLKRLLAEVGVGSTVEARTALGNVEAAKKQASGARKSLNELLDGRNLDDLAEEHRLLREHLEQYVANREAEEPLPATVTEAGERRKDATDAERDALDAANGARGAADRAIKALSEANLSLAHLKQAVTLKEEALHETERVLEQARESITDDELRERRDRVAKHLEETKKEHTVAEAEYQSLNPSQVEVLLGNQSKAIAGLAKEKNDVQSTLDQERGALQALQSEGFQEDVETHRREAERAEREANRVARLAGAANLLYQTLNAHRERMLRDYQDPYRAAIEEMGRMVFGDTFAVELDEDLSIARRTLDGQTLEFRLLSTGAQEQLAVIARLAGARLASGDGVPVVLDDAFGYSDPDRLALIGAVLGTLGDQCQVIVLTCFPERYQSVGGATFVHIESLDSGRQDSVEVAKTEIAAAAEQSLGPDGRVLACLKAAGQPLAKRDLLDRAQIDVHEWQQVIGELTKDGRVQRVGAGRGSAYRLP